MIPGLKPAYEVRAKARIGVKKMSAGGKEFPAAIDYFVCDDPEFDELYPGQPSALRIRLPFAAAADCFSTGMEWWRGKQLTCYSKGEPLADAPIAAFRVQAEVGGERVIGDTMGRDRVPIECRFRSCPKFITGKDCKPTARLQFFLDGGRMDSVLQFDTHSWNTIEGIEAALSNLGDLRGRLFELSVAFVQKGRDRFPVVSILEVKMDVNTDVDVARADQLLMLSAAISSGDEAVIRTTFAETLDFVRPGWKDDPAVVARVKLVGPTAAAKGFLEKYSLAV